MNRSGHFNLKCSKSGKNVMASIVPSIVHVHMVFFFISKEKKNTSEDQLHMLYVKREPILKIVHLLLII